MAPTRLPEGPDPDRPVSDYAVSPGRFGPRVSVALVNCGSCVYGGNIDVSSPTRSPPGGTIRFRVGGDDTGGPTVSGSVSQRQQP